MAILSFLIHLAGATMLLLYAVRMVRTGIERAFGPSFRRVLVSAATPVRAVATGLVMAMVLQSSAAVALLVAGFAGTGALSFAAGLSAVLGADLGSALLIGVLSLRLDWLVPLLLALGGTSFLRTDSRRVRQMGRIVLGIAFILIALRFLRETVEPIQSSEFLPAVAAYLERDVIAAFGAGAVLAFLMHSSVAAILVCVTLTAVGALPVAAGASLVLGANLGSGLIPVYLSRSMPRAARRVPLANLVLRGAGAVIAAAVVANAPVLDWLGGLRPGETLIALHVLFNLCLLAAVPAARRLEAPFARLLPEVASAEADNPIFRSVLEDTQPATAALALANIRREVLRMAQIVEGMCAPVMELYDRFDKPRMTEIRSRDAHVNTALDQVRRYTAALPADLLDKAERREARELTEYAIALETAGDIVARRLLPLAQEKASKGLKLSDEGQGELVAIHERVLANIELALNVLVTDDMESARLLLEEKSEMTRRERSSRKKHLKRLGAGQSISFESSDLHLETLRALREFNSQISAVAYPILFRSGQLLESRLVDAMDARD